MAMSITFTFFHLWRCSGQDPDQFYLASVGPVWCCNPARQLTTAEGHRLSWSVVTGRITSAAWDIASQTKGQAKAKARTQSTILPRHPCFASSRSPDTTSSTCYQQATSATALPAPVLTNRYMSTANTNHQRTSSWPIADQLTFLRLLWCHPHYE